MSKGLKKNFPMYAKKEDVAIQGFVDLARLTPKTFNSFIKAKHGPEASVDDYIVLDIINYAKED